MAWVLRTMWPFRSRGEFSELEERLDKLERAHRDQALEFENLYDKVLRALQRITKRAQVVESADAATDDAPAPEVPAGMTQRAWEAQQRILRHRSIGGARS